MCQAPKPSIELRKKQRMTKFLTFEAPCPALAGQGASNVSNTNPPLTQSNIVAKTARTCEFHNGNSTGKHGN